MDKIAKVAVGVIDLGSQFNRNRRYYYKVVTYDGDDSLEVVPGLYTKKQDAITSKNTIINRVTALGKACIGVDDIAIKDRSVNQIRKDMGQIELKSMRRRRRDRCADRIYRNK
jgi:hypothetical protein